MMKKKYVKVILIAVSALLILTFLKITDVKNRLIKSEVYELSKPVTFVESSNAIEGHLFKNSIKQEGIATINLANGMPKEVPVEWILEVTCKYSKNVQTEKISSLDSPIVSLKGINNNHELTHLQVVLYNTQVQKIDNDTRIKIDVSYGIESQYYYFPFSKLHYGPYDYSKIIEN